MSITMDTTTTNTSAFGEALNHSISSGRFADAKIILYSRRGVRGVYKPKELYANSHVLKSVPYFSDLLSGGYVESEPKYFSDPIDDEEADNYGYYSDSDLEDDEGDTNARPTPSANSRYGMIRVVQEVSKRPRLERGAVKATPHFGSHSRSSSSPALSHPPVGKKRFPATHVACGEWSDEPRGKGTVIKVQDIAFITFQAFLMYLYTGRIEFAPYDPEGGRRSRSPGVISSSEDSVPRPSPKSIYRLADKYDVPLLKQLALDYINSEIERYDIVEELFSEFSSSHEEVCITFLKHLESVFLGPNQDRLEGLRARIDEKCDSYKDGDLGHAEDTFALLWELAKKSVCSNPTAMDRTPYEEPPRISANRKRAETALIKSIRKGIFYDRKYWTRRSKTARGLRPVYMSSIIVGERINDLVRMYREGEYINTGEGSDSDFECGSEQVIGPAWAAEDDEKKETSKPGFLPVLTAGSFASWRPLFFYLCTDTIQFAPLKSRGVHVRARYVQENAMADKPPPCSPKVIYSLATTLGIKALCDMASADILQNISDANMAPEFFSSFTSQHEDIADAQARLSFSTFNNETTTAQEIEFIKSMSGGKCARRVGALKRGLRFFGTVLMYCAKCGNRYDRYSVKGSSTFCPTCGSLSTRCAACECYWRNEGGACSKCGRRWM